MDTIVALSTPAGRGGIAVIRLSGSPLAIVRALFSSSELSGEPSPNHMYLGKIECGGFSDIGYFVYFKSPKSYTGEDVAELHIHGGIRIADGIIRECVRLGARPAERGEFTRRAFLNGKMRLADAEGVIDMINADSEEAVRAAYREMTGALSGEISILQNQLKDVVSSLEAVLDYPEELEEETLPEAEAQIKGLLNRLTSLLKSMTYGRMVKRGIEVVITGAPNAGKSSLMNAMLGENRVIVSDIRGTTRDTVSASVEYRGKKFNLTDTAGLRESEDNIEKEGVKRAISAVRGANVIIRLHALDECAEYSEYLDDEILSGKTILDVYNKVDVVPGVKRRADAYYISAKTGEGIEELMDKIAEIFEAERMPEGEVLTSERHYFAVKNAADKLGEAVRAYGEVTSDCIIPLLTEAWRSLGEITGESVTEDIIDNIFDKFCVGK